MNITALTEAYDSLELAKQSVDTALSKFLSLALPDQSPRVERIVRSRDILRTAKSNLIDDWRGSDWYDATLDTFPGGPTDSSTTS